MTKDTEEYPYEKIEKLALRIRNMKDKKFKKDLIYIKNLIILNNPDISMIQNNNGYFAPEFEKLSYGTYIELTKYFDKIDNKNSIESESEKNMSDYYNYKKNENMFDKGGEKKLKYTNSENIILNKLKYEKALKQHQSECEEKNLDDENDRVNKIKNEHIRIKNLKIKKNEKNDEIKSEKIFKKHNKN
jgi:hypothetical protein